MNRGFLAIGAAVVLAALFGLLVVLRSGTDGEPRATSASAKPGPKIDAKIAQADPGKPMTGAPARAPGATATPAGSGSAGRDYMIGDVHVRDHRSGDHAPLDVPPAVHAPGGRKVPSELVYAITQKVRAVISECVANLPSEGRGDKPRVDGEIEIAIKNQLATVTEATIQLRDVVGATVESVKQCIEQKSIGVATASGDEPDVERYAITMSVRLP
jgi:hypothetical protein